MAARGELPDGPGGGVWSHIWVQRTNPTATQIINNQQIDNL